MDNTFYLSINIFALLFTYFKFIIYSNNISIYRVSIYREPRYTVNLDIPCIIPFPRYLPRYGIFYAKHEVSRLREVFRGNTT